jgi:hypothetical protein
MLSLGLQEELRKLRKAQSFQPLELELDTDSNLVIPDLESLSKLESVYPTEYTLKVV